MTEPTTELAITPALAPLRDSIARLPDMTPEEVLILYEQAAFMAQQLKALRDELKDAMVEYIREHGEINAGNSVRYVVGTEKRTKCRDRKALLHALLEACGGDLDRLGECLASDAFKHGACRKVLEDQWDAHFSVEVVYNVETKTPKMEVKRIDGQNNW